ncbi:MAG: glycosyltransferase [Chitinophagales bacterium]|nr:glycosyltransferase [Chitinophagales bacterium]
MNFLLYLFIACCIYQIAYQLVLLTAIIRHKNNSASQPVNNSIIPSVSVIICAKNERENLQKNLPAILNQHYPAFEVILVDDGSDEQITITDERLTIITLSKEEKIGLGKKYALQKGIEAAKKELILLTDADCWPVSENWITEMAGCINDKHKIVLGISPYETTPTFLNGLIEYETAQTALQYTGFALLGNPYMSVGRNVLYDAILLKSKKWSAEELSIASGDDDLAIQSLATKDNTAVCLSKESYTISEPKKIWKDWIQQKMRHYESGSLYKLSHRIQLGAYLFTKLLTYACLFYLLFSDSNEKSIPAGIFFFYFISITLLNLSLNYFLHLNKRWYFSLLNDILYCIFTVTMGFWSQLKPVRKWK